MKLQPGIVGLVIAHACATFSGGEHETTADIYPDRCVDLTGVSVRFCGRESTTISED
jgi:hypothetical protein